MELLQKYFQSWKVFNALLMLGTGYQIVDAQHRRRITHQTLWCKPLVVVRQSGLSRNRGVLMESRQHFSEMFVYVLQRLFHLIFVKVVIFLYVIIKNLCEALNTATVCHQQLTGWLMCSRWLTPNILKAFYFYLPAACYPSSQCHTALDLSATSKSFTAVYMLMVPTLQAYIKKWEEIKNVYVLS